MKVSQEDYDYAIHQIESGVWSKVDAAEYCGVTSSAVSYWCKREGLLPGITEPGRWAGIEKLKKRGKPKRFKRKGT